MAKMDFCALLIDSHGKWRTAEFTIRRDDFTHGDLSPFWAGALDKVAELLEAVKNQNPENTFQLVRLQGSEYILPDQEGGDVK